jgi:hypothetical protein
MIVRYIATYGVLHGRCNSFIGNNVALCCKRYGLSYDSFLTGGVNTRTIIFKQYRNNISVAQSDTGHFLYELILLRDGMLKLTDDSLFSASDIKDIIDIVSTG